MLQKNKHYAFEFKKKSIQTGRSGNPRKQITPEAWKQAEEAFDIHTILDTVGFVPVIGEPADLVNGLIYVAEKDYINAGMPMAAVIPVVEDAGKAVKYGAKAVDKDSDIAKTLNAVRKPLAKNEGKQFAYREGRSKQKPKADDKRCKERSEESCKGGRKRLQRLV